MGHSPQTRKLEEVADIREVMVRVDLHMMGLIRRTLTILVRALLIGMVTMMETGMWK